jgi:hypothetical protein
MARRETEETVTQSVLERLIDLDPKSKNDPPQTRPQSVRQLKAALRRDLEWLLNTRQIPGGVPEEFQGSRARSTAMACRTSRTSAGIRFATATAYYGCWKRASPRSSRA